MPGEGTAGEAGQASGASRRRVVLGRVRGAHGVRGGIRVQHFTEERETLLGHPRWMLGSGGEWREYRLAGGHPHGDGLLATLEGVGDRDAAEALRGLEVAVWRDELPPLAQGEYYWSDLEGLRVMTTTGVDLGVVERVMETGANDVLVVKGDRDRLIPFLPDDVVTAIDLGAGRMEVDWDPEF